MYTEKVNVTNSAFFRNEKSTDTIIKSFVVIPILFILRKCYKTNFNAISLSPRTIDPHHYSFTHTHTLSLSLFDLIINSIFRYNEYVKYIVLPQFIHVSHAFRYISDTTIKVEWRSLVECSPFFPLLVIIFVY